MELVVDTHVLFAYFWKTSLTHKILMRSGLVLYSPEFALEEINKHEEHILEKTALTREEFRKVRSELAIAVEFVPLEKYESFLKEAAKIAPDPNDADFFALATQLKLPLWSNDALLKKQHRISVLSTSDLLSRPEFFAVFFPGK